VPSESDRLQSVDAREEHQALCFRCGTDLRDAGSSQVAAHARDLAIQRRLTRALRDHWIEVSEGHPIFVGLYFRVLRQLIDVASRGKRGAELRAVIAPQCDLSGFAPSDGVVPIYERCRRPSGEHLCV
jgi:hypothetical protein